MHVPANHTATAAISTSRSKRSREAFYSLMTSEFDLLVPRLLALEPTAAPRRAYLRSVSHLLLYDGHDDAGALGRRDAASAALVELAATLGVRVRLREDQGQEAAAGTAVRERGKGRGRRNVHSGPEEQDQEAAARAATGVRERVKGKGRRNAPSAPHGHALPQRARRAGAGG